MGSKYRELTVLESNSCLVWAKTLSTPAWSTKVTNPKPLQTSGEGINERRAEGDVLWYDMLWALRNRGAQINFQAAAQEPSLTGSRLPHLERLVTGSLITIHSFTSPYLQKYSFNPSETQKVHINKSTESSVRREENFFFSTLFKIYHSTFPTVVCFTRDWSQNN